MADAEIRLRLNAKDARKELADLRNDFAKTTAEAGGMSGGFNLNLGKLAAIGSLGLGGFALTRGVLGGARAIGQAATEGPSALLEEAALGMTGARARGSLQALQEVKAQAGLAVGLGASPESFRGLFEALQNLEQRAEEGQLKLTQTLGLDVVEQIKNEIVGKLEGIWESIKGLGKSMGIG